MRTKHGFCSMHRIAYNRDFDAICPQCLHAGINPAKQYDYDPSKGTPVDAAGKPVDLDEDRG